jgi:hypothetical protein
VSPLTVVNRFSTSLRGLFALERVSECNRAAFVKATRELEYPESDITGIGLLLLVCALLYLFPRTSILGAIVLTGYLGGRDREPDSLPSELVQRVLRVCIRVPGMGRSGVAGRSRSRPLMEDMTLVSA